MDSSDSLGGRPSAARKVALREEQLEGEPALFVPRWTAAARTGRLLLAVIVVACVAGVVIAAWAAAWGWLVLLCVVAGVVGGLWARDARRMPYDGGLWLTPTRVAHRWAGQRWSLPWEEVADQRVDPATGDVLLERRGHPEPLVISSHLLVMSSPAVVMLLGTLVADPSARSTLGTEAGRQRAEAVRDVVDRDGFRPVVHGAPRASAGLVFGAALVVIAVLLGLAALGRGTG